MFQVKIILRPALAEEFRSVDDRFSDPKVIRGIVRLIAIVAVGMGLVTRFQ